MVTAGCRETLAVVIVVVGDVTALLAGAGQARDAGAQRAQRTEPTENAAKGERNRGALHRAGRAGARPEQLTPPFSTPPCPNQSIRKHYPLVRVPFLPDTRAGSEARVRILATLQNRRSKFDLDQIRRAFGGAISGAKAWMIVFAWWGRVTGPPFPRTAAGCVRRLFLLPFLLRFRGGSKFSRRL